MKKIILLTLTLSLLPLFYLSVYIDSTSIKLSQSTFPFLFPFIVLSTIFIILLFRFSSKTWIKILSILPIILNIFVTIITMFYST